MLNEATRAEDVCGSGGMGAVVPNLDSRWNRMVTFMPWSPCHLTPQNKGPRYLLGRRTSPLRRGLCRRPVRVGFLADLVALEKVVVQVQFTVEQATEGQRWCRGLAVLFL